MRLCLFFVAAIVISLQAIVTASVEITNPKAIMSGSIIIKSNQRPEFRARLSPDGKFILFPQQVGQDSYKLFLQNIDTAEEIEIPIDFPSGYESVFTRFNFFNPKGDKLSLFSISKDQNPKSTELVIFDIPSKMLTKTGITENSSMAQFDSTGERLVVSINDSVVSLVSLKDFTPGKPITSGWVHSCSPHSPFVTIFVPPNPSQRQSGFKMLNLDTKVISDLPVHERNSRLDDITSHWSSDGSFLFSFDVKENNAGKQEAVARVWDVNSNTEKAIIPNVLCLGPGPSNNLMIMVSAEDNVSGSNLRLYDIKTGTLSPIGDGSIKGVHAWGKRIAYVEKTEGGFGRFFIADIAEVKNK